MTQNNAPEPVIWFGKNGLMIHCTVYQHATRYHYLLQRLCAQKQWKNYKIIWVAQFNLCMHVERNMKKAMVTETQLLETPAGA